MPNFKKIILLLMPMLLLATQSTEEKLELLEGEIKSLKREMQLHQEDLDERMPIIEKVETKSILDKINFSPEVLLRFDKINYKTGKIEGEDTKIYNHSNPSLNGLQRRDEYSKHFDIAAMVRFRLNMYAEIDETTHFYGRLLATNSSQTQQRLCILSRDIQSGSSSSAFDVDRAYLDYTPNRGSEYAFTFSFGLLPTTGGTPMQFAQNSKRKSMFPALVFDMNTYGVIGTQKLGKSTFLRAILAKAYSLRDNFYPYQCNRENIDGANIIGVYGDTQFNFLNSKSLLSFGINIMHDLKAHPYLGPDIERIKSQVLGNIMTIGIGLDIEKIAGSDTTFFLHTALSNPNKNSNKDDYKILSGTPAEKEAGLTASGQTGFSEADYAEGTMLSSQGYSIYLGAKYDFTSKFNVGFEYNYGSKYWFSATQGAEDMYNKLATRGHVGELYGIWKFHKVLSAKVGIMHTQEDYTGSGWHFGEPVKKDAEQKIAYLSFEAKF